MGQKRGDQPHEHEGHAGLLETRHEARAGAQADDARDVRLPRTLDFDAERQRFALRFCCEDCAHFDPSTERCRHEWPNESHRREPRPADTALVDFCKEFELC